MTGGVPGPAGGGSARWDDLVPRFGAGAVLAAIVLAVMYLGGWPFRILIVAICGVILWELARMLLGKGGAGRERAIVLASLGAAALGLAFLLPPGFGLPLLLAPAMAAVAILPRHRTVFIPFGVMILLAGWGIAALRVDFGFAWMAWLGAVVMVTDVFGYFAGRLIGGPKFWPRVSPKKTWSGTVAGWIGSALVGVAWMVWQGAGAEIIGISVALSMASQLGDMAESAVKRKMKVKDSSSLLPGHGGLFDRFDGMLGASILLLIVQAAADFPPAPLLGP